LSAFKKLDHQNKREYVASQIMEAIRSGEFKVGDKLPSEQAMAESIGVSRPSVREALGALRIVGIIETINGVGTVVKKDRVEFLSEGGVNELSSILGHEGNTFEVLEARKVLEPAVAVYATETMTEENLFHLEEILQNMAEAAKNKDFSEYHEANKRFHLRIASSTQNSFLTRSVNSLLHLFTESDFGAEMRRRYLTDDSYIVESLEVHRRILECLKKRDRSGLIKAFEDHDRQVQKQLIGQ
jgi:GntR family transcriptional repressor for pyruvate dehydrogenase complex